MAPDAGGCEVLLSTLGFTAPSRGGAYLALDRVYQDPSGVASGRVGIVGRADIEI
jgi:hypothetical protein